MELRGAEQDLSPGEDAAGRVLASALTEGHEVQVVEFGDGSLAIRYDGAVPQPYRWAPAQIRRLHEPLLASLAKVGGPTPPDGRPAARSRPGQAAGATGRGQHPRLATRRATAAGGGGGARRARSPASRRISPARRANAC